ncbi:hypothetical protein FHL15_005072 [Xylaria flabelliformis]|uniref:Myb-like domain-containing protein n=1 Tax=Xylaria flabelliformis TaxID=2512241 RepID=A0A553I1B5_9PEZI|nr:hypothetical protein FHL15_005072 [Xylaria flabelliformis]
MNTRRTRATSRREESLEPQGSPVAVGAVTRRTRSGPKRAEVEDASPQSKSSKSTYHLESGIPQRGTRRRRRRSLESVATNDFPKSSGEHASPEHPLTGIVEPVVIEDRIAASNVDSQSDSYEDRVARLQDILDFDLPKLCRWCDKTYEALKSLTRPEPTAEERKNLNTARKSFKLARRLLAEDDAAYIDLSSSDLPYRDDQEAETVIQKATRLANLVSLLLSLTDLKRSNGTILPFLRELDTIFPTFLDSPSKPPESQELVFRVRCRRLAECLSEEPEREPLVLAAAIFCEGPADTSEEAAKSLRKGPFRTFGGMEQGEDFTSSRSFKAQLNGIVDKLASQERAKTEQYLNTTFPRDKLLEQLREWALDMYVHVNKKADDSSLPPGGHDEGAHNDGAGHEDSERSFHSGNDESEEGSDSELSSEPEQYHQLKTLIKEPSFIQDPSTLAAVRRRERDGSKRPETDQPTDQPTDQRATKRNLTESQMREAIRQLDPADILGSSNPDDGTGSGAAPLDTRASYPRSRSGSRELGATRKRTRSQDEDGDYVDDNDDFEVNVQLIDESRRIRHDDSDVPRRPPKRPRFAGNTTATQIRERDLTALSQVARANKLANRARGHQLRERWSDVDTDHLLNLIADRDLNCSWSAMEKEGGFQTPRNQQAIRDKARNLKKGYLCADAILPSGFDYVYLSKKERDDVIASGHNPDRSENDIDEHGRVTRNLWRDVES